MDSYLLLSIWSPRLQFWPLYSPQLSDAISRKLSGIYQPVERVGSNPQFCLNIFRRQPFKSRVFFCILIFIVRVRIHLTTSYPVVLIIWHDFPVFLTAGIGYYSQESSNPRYCRRISVFSKHTDFPKFNQKGAIFNAKNHFEPDPHRSWANRCPASQSGIHLSLKGESNWNLIKETQFWRLLSLPPPLPSVRSLMF